MLGRVIYVGKSPDAVLYIINHGKPLTHLNDSYTVRIWQPVTYKSVSTLQLWRRWHWAMGQRMEILGSPVRPLQRKPLQSPPRLSAPSKRLSRFLIQRDDMRTGWEIPLKELNQRILSEKPRNKRKWTGSVCFPFFLSELWGSEMGRVGNGMGLDSLGMWQFNGVKYMSEESEV